MRLKPSLSKFALLLLTLGLSACGDSNNTPLANAGDDQSLNERTQVTLTGVASDNDGVITGYQWQQLSGSSVTLDTPTNATTTFTSPEVTGDEALVFELTVTDDDGNKGTDTVNIQVINVNQLPSANAGSDQSVAESTQFTLQGSGSDPDGQIVSYLWQQTGGTIVNLESVDNSELTFTTPALTTAENLSFSLTVTDNNGANATDSVEVNVFNVNQAPLVEAGNTQQADEQTFITLQGSATDADGNIESYLWEQISGTGVNLYNTHLPEISIYTPPIDTDETLIFRLTATDNQGATASDQVEVTVLALEGLIRDIVFGDSNLRDCVNTTATENNWRTVDQMTSLTCGFEGLSNFVGIEQLTSLIQLNLYEFNAFDGVSQASDLTPLANLTELTDLNLQFNLIEDITPLANLTKLTDLRLTFGKIQDITPLESLVNLTSLDLQENLKISDISSLANLTSLTYLVLSFNRISNIDALSQLTGLTALDLTGNQFTELSILSDFISLDWLGVGYNGNLTDITGIFNLPNLSGIFMLMSNNIPCADLDTLQTNMPNTSITLPSECVGE